MKNTILLALAFVFIGIYSCKNSEKSDKKGNKKIELYVFDGGSILVNKLEVFSQDTTYQGQTKRFADAFYVIKHPKGNLIWDTGLPEALIKDEPFTTPDGAFTLKRSDSLPNQLQKIGLTIADFDYIALSHHHFDHTGYANQFKDATWLVQESEYNFLTNDSTKVKSPDTYKAIKELTKIKKINGDFDVFGDGKVIIKSTPGHTIGHQSLFVDAGLAKPVLLTGDLYHFEENRASKGVPSFNYNVQQTLQSMDAFEAFATEKNAEVFIQHSPKSFKKLKKILNNIRKL